MRQDGTERWRTNTSIIPLMVASFNFCCHRCHFSTTIFASRKMVEQKATTSLCTGFDPKASSCSPLVFYSQ